MEFKPANIIATATAVIGLIAGIVALDSRYAKEDDFGKKLTAIKNDIIGEMRKEVVLNRTVMIANMQREADDLEFQINQLEASNKPVPRFMIEKYKQINREIEDLKNENPNNTD